MGFSQIRIWWMFLVLVVCVFTLCLDLCCGEGHVHTHHCNHGHDHHHHHHHHGHHDEFKQQSRYIEKDMNFGSKLAEELAEEEDLKLYGFGIDHGHHHHHDHTGSELSGLGLWMNALGCSLLVSLASLICLILLPVIFIQGKPSKAMVDSLALFGAGAMLGDAFLHQLPHAFGGDHSHSHDHTGEDDHHHDHGHSHAHSLKDLSIGLCVLAGIVIFLLVEKIVRYVEHNTGGHDVWGHGHHHHHNKTKKKLKDGDDEQNETELETSEEKADAHLDGEKLIESESVLRKRNTTSAANDDEKTDLNVPNGSTDPKKSLTVKEPAQPPSSLVFGYLNLFSDGVHNFTDGMALGSAFLLYGSVGGWSRTLFLLAHELPQEVGDFGILVRSGFSVFKALFFNFLSALAALAGTALALLWGQDPGQSSLIEGFTAGGFIYIAVAGVLAEMNSNGSPSIKSTLIQLTSLISGMAIALCISLIE